VAAAGWAAAEWMSSKGRQQANKEAGEDIYFANDKAAVKTVKGCPNPTAKLTAPLFNLVSSVILPTNRAVVTIMLKRSMIRILLFKL
jgi:hypothetical protein